MSNPLTKTKPKRRWLQFSIRTLLVLVTLLCVGLSLWIASAERRRRAVVAVEALGGSVGYAVSQTRLQRWLPLAYVNEVIDVRLANTPAADAGLVNLKGLTGLLQLLLSNTQVTDAGLAHLKGLATLGSLHLENRLFRF